MSITKISSDGYNYGNLDLYSALSTGQTSNDNSLTSSILEKNKTAKSDSLDLSGPAEFFNKLKKLQETDPEKFKEVCKEIAAKLRSAAKEEGNSSETNMISALADKFESAAETGDISLLKPPPPPPPFFNPTQNAASIYSQNSQISLVDLMNSNKNQSGISKEMDDIISSVLNKVNGAA